MSSDSNHHEEVSKKSSEYSFILKPILGDKNDKHRFSLKFWKPCFYLFIFFIFVCFLLITAYVIYLIKDLPDETVLRKKLIPYRSMTFLDRNGIQIAPSGSFVSIEMVPQSTIKALTSIEDRRFFSHFGVDFIGILRAGYYNLKSGRIVQGGSTLTQQLARNLYLNNQKTFKRKLQESLLAFWLERNLSKAEILELYLNHVYFGAGAWGIESASERYFKKTVSDLTLGESALLVGLLRAPSHYNPTSTPERAEIRTNIVLKEMLRSGKITQSELNEVYAHPIEVNEDLQYPGAGYFLDWISEIVKPIVEESTTAHLIIETTLDLDMQNHAEMAIQHMLNEVGVQRRIDQGALIAFDGTGAVLVMVGGRSYTKGGFNRTYQAMRQPGSAFKPFVYLSALESGISPWEKRIKASPELDGWSPRNASNNYEGESSLVNALAFSVNTIAVRLTEEIGREKVIQTAKNLGYSTRLEPNRSLALGAQETNLMTLTSSYIPFANHGYRVIPYGVRRIYTKDGELIYQTKPNKEKAIDENNLKRINMMLERVVKYGTGYRANITGRYIAGKTGTTNHYRDAWFIGYVPGFIAGVWYGNDYYKKMDKVYGGLYPAITWKLFAQKVLKGRPVERLPFIPPPPPKKETDEALEVKEVEQNKNLKEENNNLKKDMGTGLNDQEEIDKKKRNTLLTRETESRDQKQTNSDLGSKQEFQTENQ